MEAPVAVEGTTARRQAISRSDAIAREALEALLSLTPERACLLRNGRIVAHSAAWKADVRGQRLGDIVHSDDRKTMMKALDRLKTANRMRVRVKDMAGETIVIEARVRGAWIWARVRPWTARQAEAQLRDLRHIFRSVVERARDAIFIKDLHGRYVFINPAGAALLGLDVEAVLGKHDRELLGPEGADHYDGIDQKVLSTEKPWTYQPRRSEVQGKTLFTTKYPYYNADGELAGLIGISHDVSQWMDAQDKARELEARLVHSDRLAAVGTLAAGVTHEINNPLTVVLRHLELAEELAATDELQLHLSKVKNGAERIARVTGDLMGLARDPASGREAVDLDAVLEKALSLAENELRHRAEVVREFGGVSAVEGHEGRLFQVFLNLLLNASRALEVGHATEYRLTVRTFVEDEWIVAQVEDNGPGVPEELKERMWKPFVTGGKGTGLGLWICHTIVTGLGGRIALEDTPVGATFTVRLRPAEVKEQGLVEDVTAPRRLPLGRLRVLVIDDEPDICDILEAGLTAHADVTVLHSGREAQELVAVDDRWDRIFCDLMMPEVTGIEVFESLPPELQERVVFVTGGAFTADARRFLDATTNPTLHKPFRLKQVRAILGVE